MNINICDKPIAPDIIYYETYAIDNGYTCTQLLFGTKSLVSDVYGMKTIIIFKYLGGQHTFMWRN